MKCRYFLNNYLYFVLINLFCFVAGFFRTGTLVEVVLMGTVFRVTLEKIGNYQRSFTRYSTF